MVSGSLQHKEPQKLLPLEKQIARTTTTDALNIFPMKFYPIGFAFRQQPHVALLAHSLLSITSCQCPGSTLENSTKLYGAYM